MHKYPVVVKAHSHPKTMSYDDSFAINKENANIFIWRLC